MCHYWTWIGKKVGLDAFKYAAYIGQRFLCGPTFVFDAALNRDSSLLHLRVAKQVQRDCHSKYNHSNDRLSFEICLCPSTNAVRFECKVHFVSMFPWLVLNSSNSKRGFGSLKLEFLHTSRRNIYQWLKPCPNGKCLATKLDQTLFLVTKHVDVVPVSNMSEHGRCPNEQHVLQCVIHCLSAFRFYYTRSNKVMSKRKNVWSSLVAKHFSFGLGF